MRPWCVYGRQHPLIPHEIQQLEDEARRLKEDELRLRSEMQELGIYDDSDTSDFNDLESSFGDSRGPSAPASAKPRAWTPAHQGRALSLTGRSRLSRESSARPEGAPDTLFELRRPASKFVSSAKVWAAHDRWGPPSLPALGPVVRRNPTRVWGAAAAPALARLQGSSPRVSPGMSSAPVRVGRTCG
jgi:hypothetical protein